MSGDESPTESHDETLRQPEGADYLSGRRFADFPISEATLRGIHDHGYVDATPIQAATIEAAVQGRDVVARAKTGTGKTAAFCIPIIERVEGGGDLPEAIVLAPTRELATQIAEECASLAAGRDEVSIALLVGGVAMGPQETALASGPTILVGTPGRVLDHERRGNLDLSGIRVACLDEADEMFSMGFVEDVSKMLLKCPDDRQILLFSATMSGDTDRVVKRFCNDPKRITLSTDADKVEGIDHVLYEAPASFHKARALLFLLDNEDPDAAIIFCNTREDTSTIANYLDRQGLDVLMLSGELPQKRRSQVMKRVKAGEVRFLVATDVAARGIDISDLTHVINYALPADATVYLHRIGRTGRLGRKGTAISLVGATDMATRKALETRHDIDFEVRELPSQNQAVRRRVERQAKQIKSAMGTMVFESYLPTVEALLERPDGKPLLAAALRAFFQWDRARKAELAGVPDEPLNIRPRDRKNRDDDDRGGRGRGRSGGTSGGRSTDRKPRGRKRDPVDESALDDLLTVGGDAKKADDLDAALQADDAPKKKRKRRRKKKASDGASATPAAASSDELVIDDLDDLLVEDAPKPKKKRAKKKAPSDDVDDLDDLLSMD